MVGRASIVAYFLITDLIGLAFLSHQGFVTLATAKLALLFLPALVLGVWVGARSFKSADPRTFRRLVLILLAVLAVLTALQAASALAGP